MSTSPTPLPPVPSEQAVSYRMREGFQDMVVYTGAGVLVGGMVGLMLTRGPSARKVLTGLGAGTGFGVAWTNTNIRLESMLAPYYTATTSAAAKPIEQPLTGSGANAEK